MLANTNKIVTEILQHLSTLGDVFDAPYEVEAEMKVRQRPFFSLNVLHSRMTVQYACLCATLLP